MSLSIRVAREPAPEVETTTLRGYLLTKTAARNVGVARIRREGGGQGCEPFGDGVYRDGALEDVVPRRWRSGCPAALPTPGRRTCCPGPEDVGPDRGAGCGGGGGGEVGSVCELWRDEHLPGTTGSEC
jgi:hypothetical protein